MDIESLRGSLQSVEAIVEALDSLTYNLNDVYGDILDVLNDETEQESIDDKVDKALVQHDFEYLLMHNDEFRESMKSGGRTAVDWMKSNPSILHTIYISTCNEQEAKSHTSPQAWEIPKHE